MVTKRILRVAFGVVLSVFGGISQSAAHEIVGVQSYYRCQPTLARAFIRSPNPGSTNHDYPLVVVDANGRPTGEYMVVITLQNQSDFDARVTAVGFDWPEGAGFELVQLFRSYNQLTTNNNGTRTGVVGPNDYAAIPSLTIPQAQGDVALSIREDTVGVPGFARTALSVALVTGNTFAGGRPGDGLAVDGDRHQVAFKGVLPAATGLSPIETLLDDAYVRFRQVGLDGDGSETGVLRTLLPSVSCP